MRHPVSDPACSRPHRAHSHRAHTHRPGHLALAALVVTAAGCHGGDGDDHCHTCGPPPAEVYQELEPNDSPFFPDRIAVVDAYTFLYVDGYVESVGFDVVDHLEFHSATPATYDFRIDALSAFGDVDVMVYDPVADVVVGVYEFSGSFETGRITVHEPDRPFQIIVTAYLVDTAWSLELVGGFYSGPAGLSGGPGGEDVTLQDATTEPSSSELPGADGADRARERVSPIEVQLLRAEARE